MYFESPGPQNTDKALDIAVKAAKERGIGYVVVASTFGDTARKAVDLIKGTELKLVVVTHNTGFAKPGGQQFSPQIREEVEKAGGKVLTGTMVLRNIGTAIRGKFGYSQQDLINTVLRMFGEGIKVCVEMAAMACDAGLIPPEEVVAVAGTGRGADTAVIVAANSSNNFFDIKVKEILAKPKNF